MTKQNQIIGNHHSFDVAVASELGIPKAIILKEFAAMCLYNQQVEKNIHAGFAWCYYTAAALSQKHPYMKSKSISRWLTEMREAGLMYACDFWNKRRNDRTLWFTINFDAYNNLVTGKGVDADQASEWIECVQNCISQNEETISQNEETISQNEATLPSHSFSYPSLSGERPNLEKEKQDEPAGPTPGEELTIDQMEDYLKNLILNKPMYMDQVNQIGKQYDTKVMPIIRDVLEEYLQKDQWVMFTVPLNEDQEYRRINKIFSRVRTFLNYRKRNNRNEPEATPQKYDLSFTVNSN